MMDFVNKSMKSIYMNLSPEVKCDIEMVKVMQLQFDSVASPGNDNESNTGNDATTATPSNRMESIVIAITLPDNQLNVYQMVVDFTIEFLCVYSNKFPAIESIDMIEPVNYIMKYQCNRPMIAIGANVGSEYNKDKSYLRFVSLKENNVMDSIDFPCWISSVCFKQKYFGVGLVNGVIKIYGNESLKVIYSIDQKGILNEGMNYGIERMNIVSSFMIDKKKDKEVDDNDIEIMEEDDKKASCFKSYDIKVKDGNNPLKASKDPDLDVYMTKQFYPNKKHDNIISSSTSGTTVSYSPIFDMTENYLIYHISKDNISGKQSQPSDTQSNANNNPSSSAFDMAYGALYNLKEWSFKSITDYNNLIKSTNIKSNEEISKKVKSNPIYINVFNLNQFSLSSKPEHQDKILVPFFQDGLSIIKSIINGKYVIIGNKHSQLFFIYELYPQTNQKYSNDGQNYKIIFSLFRGNRPSHISAVDINKSYAVITSHRGSHHVYSLPHRDNQISEDLFNQPSSLSSSSISSADYLNQKITNGLEISNLKHMGKLYYSKIITIDKVYLDPAILTKLTEDSSHNTSNTNSGAGNNTRFSSVIRNENFLLAITDNAIEIHLLYNNDKMLLLKKLKLNLNEDKDIIYSNFINSLKPEMLQFSKIQLNKRFLAETETTDKNFCVMQSNPLFTFNVINNTYQYTLGLGSNNPRKTSTERYLIIECPIEFSIVSIANKSITMIQSQKAKNAKNDLYLYESLLCKEINYKKNAIVDNKRKSIDLYSDMLLSANKKVIINPKYEEMSNSLDIKNNFYNNKDSILESNIKNALETNIKDMISKNNTVEKPAEKFVIRDNYYK